MQRNTSCGTTLLLEGVDASLEEDGVEANDGDLEDIDMGTILGKGSNTSLVLLFVGDEFFTSVDNASIMLLG